MRHSLRALGAILGAALVGAIANGCGGSSNVVVEAGSAAASSSVSSTGSGTGDGAGSTSAVTSSSAGGAGGVSGASSGAGGGGTSSAGSGGGAFGASSGVGGAGGTGGGASSTGAGTGGTGASDPCAGTAVAGAFASGFRNDGTNFQVGDTDVYVLSARDTNCPAQVWRVPKNGGPKVLVQGYSGTQDVWVGGITDGRFCWLTDDHLWSVPLAGGPPAKGYWLQEGPSYELALNTTDAFVTQPTSVIDIVRVPLAGGAADAIDALGVSDSPFDFAADDSRLYVITPDQAWGMPLTGGPSVVYPALPPLGSTLAMDATSLYFLQNQIMSSVPKGGGTITPLATLGANVGVHSIAVNDVEVYWVQGDSIMRVPKAGGTPEVVASNQASPLRVRLDTTYVYWSTSGDGALWRQPK